MEFTNFPDEITEIEVKEEQYPGFEVKDDKSADWAIRQIATDRKEHDRIAELIKAYRAELDFYESQNDARLEGSERHLSMLLENYFETVEKKETKTQETYKLLSGQLVRKKAADKPKHDEAMLLEYLEANGLTDYVKVTKKAAWGDFKKTLTFEDCKAITEDGEVLDFITFEHEDARFEVKI